MGIVELLELCSQGQITITHTIEMNEKVNVRLKQGNETYKVEFKYTQRNLRATKPMLVGVREDWVTHSWTDADCFNTLTAKSIQDSTERADYENRQQELQRQTDWDLAEYLYEEHPRLTAQDVELIQEFLNVDQ